MTNFFPADVSLRVEGDLEEAQKLFPRAKQLLFKALDRQRASGATNVRMFDPRPDGSVTWVVLSGALKIVYVSPAPLSPPLLQQNPTTAIPEDPKFFPYVMWSGVARPSDTRIKPQIITGPNDDPPPDAEVSLLDQFHPDRVSSTAYNLTFAWQTPHKLGVNDAGSDSVGDASCAFPKPGCYSGAMKRCAQAILGIGITETETEGFISEELPLTYPLVNVWNQYDWKWLRTHGIHKSPNDGAVWLIEVSKLNGVLAMPLPLFTGTSDDAFMAWLDAFGDTDTMNVVLEFGGLPTGEPMPTGATLADAITSGKVLQLLTAGDIAEFYHDSANVVDKSGLFDGYGWAFSESGAAADNLTFWLKNPTATRVDDATYQTNSDGLGDIEPVDQRFTSVQWWRITFNLDSRSSEEHPFGTGSAVMTLIEESIVYNEIRRPDRLFAGLITGGQSQPLLLAATADGSEGVGKMVFLSRPAYTGSVHDADQAANISGRAPVHIFYDGERIEVVRFVPVTAGFFWTVSGFTGDSLDMGAASIPRLSSLTDGMVGLAIPAFCREGYVLVKASGMLAAAAVPDPKPDDLTFTIAFQGFFPRIGVIDFGGYDELFISVLDFSPYITFYTLSHKWLELFGYAVPFSLTCGANFNAGPTLGYVMTNGMGVKRVDNSSTPGGPYTTRFDYISYLQPASIADLDVPITVRTEQVTFVGSV